jgi:aminoglycoside 6'-N-acetyltransferase
MDHLRDADLALRRPEPRDDEALRRLMREPEVLRWWVDGEVDHDHGWIVEAGGEFAGWVQVYEETEPHYRHVALDIALTTARHDQGLGRRVLKIVIDHFAAEGHHRFTIDPNAANQRAIRCYSAVGFRPVGILRSYERDARGDWNDGLLMDLVIES